MAGIYVHIPFCRKACHYCNFHFSTNLSGVSKLVDKICEEIAIRKNELQGQAIKTIYFGGGTPSLLSTCDLEKIVNTIHKELLLNDQMEVTLEANPEDISNDKLESWYDLGVNRLSIGIQSFLEKDLVYMNRAHDAAQSHQALQWIEASKFENVTADLMFGLVGSTMSEWESNLQQMVAYQVPHLSLYNLTIEEQTFFAHQLKKSELEMIDEDQQRQQFYKASELLTEHGYDHYEISNYAQSGNQAQHNTNYWDRVPYLGIGPAAHSMIGHRRTWNVSNNAAYLKEDFSNLGGETLSEIDQYNEVIMLGLRRSVGIRKSELRRFSSTIQQHFRDYITSKLEQGVLLDTPESYVLSKEYWYVSDALAEEMMTV